jgi:hypothetical protein
MAKTIILTANEEILFTLKDWILTTNETMLLGIFIRTKVNGI